MKEGKLYIGTSGWVYSHWQGIFYPEDLSGKDKLKYFSQHFKTTEINYSFYHLPKPTTYQNWYKQTPKDFIFSVKASRFITHTCLAGRQVKRLKEVKDAWRQFLENALNLKEKLGPILFQFPPNFSATDENMKRLKDFLILTEARDPTSGLQSRGRGSVKYAFEFRHQTWCGQRIYKLLKKYNCAWVISDSPSFPKAEEITADFIYIRMHGSKILFSSKYTNKELKNLAQKIKKWQKENKDVYIYFNNDALGYAVENAKQLLNYV
ncbi:DUF72 domain-containing protein [Candidatus Parcubacteria bacterium]|nr:DUF72 domain-containing protein [Candidatus Parcubacteria bacterium]